VPLPSGLDTGHPCVVDLHRYWLEFQRQDAVDLNLRMGCGVTAFDVDDALALLAAVIGRDVPQPALVKEDVDVSTLDAGVDLATLDAGHVLRNIYPPNERGVWFPMRPLR